MKRIALQYSGEIRNILDCFNNHYETFIETNPDYQVDIFAHFWDYDHEHRKRQNFVKFVNPTSVIFEKPKDFSDTAFVPDPRFAHPIKNVLSMFYSMEQSNNIRIRYEQQNKFKYDYVIRLRSDSFFSKPVGSIDNYDKDHVHTWHGFFHLEYGLADHFAIGSSKNMDKFLSVYSNLDTIINMGAAVNPECLFGFNAIRFHNIPVKFHNWKFYKWDYMLIKLNE